MYSWNRISIAPFLATLAQTHASCDSMMSLYEEVLECCEIVMGYGVFWWGLSSTGLLFISQWDTRQSIAIKPCRHIFFCGKITWWLHPLISRLWILKYSRCVLCNEITLDDCLSNQRTWLDFCYLQIDWSPGVSLWGFVGHVIRWSKVIPVR